MSELSKPEKRVHPLDRLFHANQAKLTSALSPASGMLAYLDWAVHLANSPGKQAELFQKALRKSAKFGLYAARRLSNKEERNCIEPLPQDHRFRATSWQRLPYSLWYQLFLMHQQWWHNATVGVEGVAQHHENVVAYSARQILDVFSPSNFLFTNPEVLKVTMSRGGTNLLRGCKNFIEDWQRAVQRKPPVGTEQFRVGKELAITPGNVIYRNYLIELIQYAPTRERVHPEPILIVPAWIMKYYILDLSPANSMVKYLVDQGYTVFMISWKNPDEADRNVGMEDYINSGVMAALEAVRAVVPEQTVHSVGYCIGGTLLSIAAAVLGRDGKQWLKSVTLFAAQTDFTEAGELMLFIDQSQLDYLEDMMWDQGYLDTRQMAGAFRLLRSNDLIWSRVVQEYLLGERTPMTDLMAWNADATRMPYRMHSEYLRRLFLNNDLAEGHYYVGDQVVVLTDIHVPIFVVGAEKDHVAPWKSVYKINLFADTDVTFLLTSGGHNAGIISEPGLAHRHYRIATKEERAPYVGPDRWFAATPPAQNSWWPAWVAWLSARSGEPVKPPPVGKPEAGLQPLCDAPGTYVLQQ